METTVNRRQFVAGSAALTAAAAGMVAGAGAARADEAPAYVYPIPDILSEADFAESMAELGPIACSEERTYDVVVVGAGTAGVPAALSAFEEGASVACLQRNPVAISQGSNGSGFILEKCDEGGLLRFMQAFNNECQGRAGLNLLRMYVDNSGETIQWIEDRVTKAGMEPFSSNDMVFEYEDGAYTAVAHQISYGPKPRDCGDAMRALADYAAEQGVEFFYSTPGVQLIKEDGRVTGVIGKADEGVYIRFNATKGVVLATGDYQNNAHMVKRFCPDVADFDKKQFDKTGDGHLMGMLVGAQMENVGHTHMMHDFDSGPMGSVPFLCLNDNGERFMNEETQHIWVNDILRYQPNPGWYSSFFDSDYEAQCAEMGQRSTPVEKLEVYIPGFYENPEGVRAELINTHRADTIEELAEMMGLPVDAVVASIARYNELVDAGEDTDFGKNAKFLKPIKTPPFWGVHRHIRVSSIDSGLLINEKCQCIDADRQPIPGLYAAGNTSGQLCGCADWCMYCSGMSVGWAYCTGRVAGRNAATLG